MLSPRCIYVIKKSFGKVAGYGILHTSGEVKEHSYDEIKSGMYRGILNIDGLGFNYNTNTILCNEDSFLKYSVTGAYEQSASLMIMRGMIPGDEATVNHELNVPQTTHAFNFMNMCIAASNQVGAKIKRIYISGEYEPINCMKLLVCEYMYKGKIKEIWLMCDWAYRHEFVLRFPSSKRSVKKVPYELDFNLTQHSQYDKLFETVKKFMTM